MVYRLFRKWSILIVAEALYRGGSIEEVMTDNDLLHLIEKLNRDHSIQHVSAFQHMRTL